MHPLGTNLFSTILHDFLPRRPGGTYGFVMLQHFLIYPCRDRTRLGVLVRDVIQVRVRGQQF